MPEILQTLVCPSNVKNVKLVYVVVSTLCFDLKWNSLTLSLAVLENNFQLPKEIAIQYHLVSNFKTIGMLNPYLTYTLINGIELISKYLSELT